jgi:hypothetical protein
MERRQPYYYPFAELGAMYIHTNYESFKANMTIGSFGNQTQALKTVANVLITGQEMREDRIESKMQDVFGKKMTIENFLKFYDVWDESLVEILTLIMKDPTSELEGKVEAIAKGGLTAILHEADEGKIKKIAEEIQLILDVVTRTANEYVKDGYINEVSALQLETQMRGHFKKLESKVGDGIIEKGLHSIFNNFKGSLTNYLQLILIAITEFEVGEGIKEAFQSDPSFSIEAVGGVSKPGADIKRTLGDLSYGFNIKSTSYETFEKHGIHIYSPKSLKNLFDHMEGLLGSNQALESFKYYIINVSRMSSSPLRGQGGNANIEAFPEGYELTRQMMRTYTTLFIGENDPSVPDSFRQADFLVLKDRIYRKSTILRNVLEKGAGEEGGAMSTLLKFTGGTPTPSGDWEAFDIRKVNLMMWTKGRYDVVRSRGFMRSAVQSVLSRGVEIKLNLLQAGKK